MYVVPRFLPVCFGDFNLDPFHEICVVYIQYFVLVYLFME